ncbi:ankyrin repeat domain protein [Nitzschia inconspicua]|uniref:Ankyrin repeat domain protein n=1 Tax=Nitzschia inconspicua TaxID=303405 RepID=A0A9K3L2T2_9STRA|nr:ankyrin repeat domain protein [Nitzschia inconspicua]
MSGGNWKDLLKAAGAGDLQLVEYHLNNGVDPNFQHAEYFTSPVFEAIRGGHLAALQMIVDFGGSPTSTEESSDLTPLEVALQESRHDIVDFLLTRLNSATDVRPYLKRIAVPLKDQTVADSTLKGLQTKLLKNGHHLYLIGEHSDDSDSLVQELKDLTKNKRINIVSDFKDLEEVDVILYFATSVNLGEEEQQRLERAKCNRLSVIFNGSGAGFASLLLGSKPTTTTAIKLHDSWLDQLTASWWLHDWVDTVVWIATGNDDDEICGAIHPYNQHKLNQRQLGGIL